MTVKKNPATGRTNMVPDEDIIDLVRAVARHLTDQPNRLRASTIGQSRPATVQLDPPAPLTSSKDVAIKAWRKRAEAVKATINEASVTWTSARQPCVV